MRIRSLSWGVVLSGVRHDLFHLAQSDSQQLAQNLDCAVAGIHLRALPDFPREQLDAPRSYSHVTNPTPAFPSHARM